MHFVKWSVHAIYMSKDATIFLGIKLQIRNIFFFSFKMPLRSDTRFDGFIALNLKMNKNHFDYIISPLVDVIRMKKPMLKKTNNYFKC